MFIPDGNCEDGHVTPLYGLGYDKVESEKNGLNERNSWGRGGQRGQLRKAACALWLTENLVAVAVYLVTSGKIMRCA